MIKAVSLTFTQLFSRPFRTVFWKSLGLTLVLLIAVWFSIQQIVTHYVVLPYDWLQTPLEILTGLGAILGLGFLIAPVSAGDPRQLPRHRTRPHHHGARRAPDGAHVRG